jgi:3-oxoacyl-(acyl-carrier-protein) synthase III
MSRSPFLPAAILGTASALPGTAYATSDLVQRVTPPRDAAETLSRTGIRRRHFAAQEDSAAGLGAAVLREALARAGREARSLRRLIFVSSMGGDQLAPANANLVAAELGLADTCDAFDLNNACMGFLTAFDVATRSVATGCAPVGIVVVELLSRYTTPADPRPFLVLADAVAAVVLDHSSHGGGVLGSWLRNDGMAGGDIRLLHAGLTGKRETFDFASSNQRMSEHAIAAIRRSTQGVLEQSGLGLADVHWVLPHQPNGSMLRAIIRELGVDRSRVLDIVTDVGSVGAASIPISLDRLLRSDRVEPGQRLLMVGVGAGISCGAILLQIGERW